MLWVVAGLVAIGPVMAFSGYIFAADTLHVSGFDGLFKKYAMGMGLSILGVLVFFAGVGVAVWQFITPAVLLYWRFVP